MEITNAKLPPNNMIGTKEGMTKAIQSVKFKNQVKIPYARHYNPRLYIFYLLFGSQKSLFKEAFSENSVSMYG